MARFLRSSRGLAALGLAVLVVAAAAFFLPSASREEVAGGLPAGCAARRLVDPSGFTTVMEVAPRWKDGGVGRRIEITEFVESWRDEK